MTNSKYLSHHIQHLLRILCWILYINFPYQITITLKLTSYRHPLTLHNNLLTILHIIIPNYLHLMPIQMLYLTIKSQYRLLQRYLYIHQQVIIYTLKHIMWMLLQCQVHISRIKLKSLL